MTIRPLRGREIMPKYCSENEKAKRAYTFYLEAASGKQSATTDTAPRKGITLSDFFVP